MWLLYTIIATLCVSVSAVLSKSAVKRTNFEVASAIYILTLSLFLWYKLLADKSSVKLIGSIPDSSYIHILLIGVLIGGAVLCFNSTLKHSDVTRAIATQRIGSVLTLIAGIVIFNNESNMFLRIIGITLIASGVLIMITGKGKSGKANWLIPGVLSAIFLTSATIMLKKNLSAIDTDITITLCLTIALLILLIAVFIRGIHSGIGRVSPAEILYSILSGICICVFASIFPKALLLGNNAVTYAVLHTSTAISVILAKLIFKDKLSWKTACGLLLIICGAMLIIFLVGVYKF